MTRARPSSRLLVGAVVTLVSFQLPAAPIANGMLKAKDTGLTEISEPHVSTVIAIDLVQPDTCEPGTSSEREGRVASFAEAPDDPSNGARLNEVVFDFASASEAKKYFKELRANESLRAECPSTEKATNFRFSKGPKHVGAARFTVTSKERISGVIRDVVSVEFLQGSHVAEIVFIDWTKGLPSVAKVAKRAAARLA